VEAAYLASSVLEDDALSVSRALSNRNGSLSATLVSGLGRHLALDHLTDLKGRIYKGNGGRAINNTFTDNEG
jgi:hypothetical protein